MSTETHIQDSSFFLDWIEVIAIGEIITTPIDESLRESSVEGALIE